MRGCEPLLGRTGTVAVILAAIALATLSAAAPLLVYTTSLAVFGLAHVAAELRYVDQRFSARLGRGTLRIVLALLALIVGLRLLGFVPGASALHLRELELAAVTALAAAAAGRCLLRGEPMAAALSVAVTATLAFGLARAPATTLVVLALLHNLTPVGFLAERLEGAARRRALALCALVFVAVPAFIMTGTLSAWLASFGLWDPDLVALGVGSIEEHVGVFVPGPWLDEPFAIDLFAAAAYLQCVHYAIVIGVLPRLGAGAASTPTCAARRLGTPAGGPLIRWPRRAVFAAIVVVASGCALAGFARAFGDARRAYGVVSALHAWSEVPVLLLAAGAGFRLGRKERRPSAATA